MAKQKLRIIPLGGLGEVGKNMTVFEMGNDAIIVDTGIMFPESDMLGIDYIIPDYRYLLEKPNLKVHGILYTHGHEDHTGAIDHVIDVLRGTPVWATPLTAGLLEVKLRDARLMNETTINVFRPGDTIKIGPFTVESFHMCHSIPDCVGFAVHTPHGLIVHSGDYKFDNSPVDGKRPDYARLAEFSRRGVLLLMADSTNAERPGWTPSESVINAAFDNVFRQAKGRIIVATFASLISRIQQVANTAQNYNRKMAIAGHSMTENVKMARKLGILNIPDDVLIELGDIQNYRPDQVVIMATGAQGEPSAVLGKLATGNHRALDVEPNDTIVLSAHAIPGNEESVSRTINRLFQRGAEVIYDPIASVHVSGHASQEEMKLLINLVQPKYFVPVHGELRQLKAHARLAASCGIPDDHIFVVENGVVIEAGAYGVRTGERVPGGYVFVDGSGVGDVGRVVIRDREMLAQDGFMVITVNLDRATGNLLSEVEIISRGFVHVRDAGELFNQVKQTVLEVIASNGVSSNERRRERVQDSVSRVLYNETKRRPMVFCVINEIELVR